MKKRFSLSMLALSALMLVGSLTGCGKGSSYEGLDKEASGEITIMLWSGSGVYFEDIGHKDLTKDDLVSQNEAAAYATAKEFNKIYPNVKVNVYAKAGGPDDNGVNWDQERENFKAEYGKYPSIFATTNLSGDISKGLVADLSTFENDPLYKSFNSSLMQMMNYEGFQGGLPQYLIPWGVYVNKSLAEDNNLDVPEPDWTIEEYTRFIKQGDGENFWGTFDVPMSFIFSGSKSLGANLLTRESTDPYVDLTGDDVKQLLEFVPEWSKNAIMPQFEAGNVPQEVMDQAGWWSYNFTIQNKVLANDGDPWMMGDAAHPDPNHWGNLKVSDWDIYPRPSTDYQDNNVGVVLDPMSVYNFCMIDGDPECTEEEAAQIKLNYTFASFWAGDTAAWQARADQEFYDNGTYRTSLNDSLPMVTGDEFNKQMDIWFGTSTHTRYGDEAKMPGFHKVLEVWEKGNIVDVSDKAYPWFTEEDGVRVLNMYEWFNIWDVNLVGATRTDSNWLDQVKSKLPDWNETINARFEKSFDAFHQGLTKFYTNE